MKKALIVGINHYGKGIEDLKGCIKDAEEVASLLAINYCENNQNGEANFTCSVLKSSVKSNEQPITRSLLKAKIKELFEDPEADVVLFYFSGHGFQNGLGGYLATQDVESFDEGVSFNDVITLANNATSKEVIIILDCCYSGNMGSVPIQNNPISTLREGVSILTASTSNQYSWGSSKGGCFTNLLCNGLRGGSADLLGNIDLVRLYRHTERMLGAWDQRPTLKVNLKTSVLLRKVEPQLPLSILKKITLHFPTLKHKIQLDPEFEPDEGNGNTSKEDQFGDLQKMANIGLVKPVIRDSMYYAAINKYQCELTPVGKQYWEMVTVKYN